MKVDVDEVGFESGSGTRICPLCEAACGLQVEVDRGRIVRARPDTEDLFSRGYACTKGLQLDAVDGDPDRLSGPLLRRGGELVPVGWDEAFDHVARVLPPLLEGDREAGAVYLGNPSGHNLDLQLYNGALLGAMRTRNLFTAASVDSMPRHLVNGMLYGTGFGIPVPDLDRTDLLIVLGSNVMVSNGSMMSVPDLPRRLRALRARGGELVVVDPVRTRTAALSDRHLAIVPGTDALFLAAMITVLGQEGLLDLGAAASCTRGLSRLIERLEPFSPRTVEARCGIPADTIGDLARRFARTRRAVAHVRLGGSAQLFGTATNFLVDVLNLVTGKLDRPGGLMFALPPTGGPNTQPDRGRGWPHSRWRSRVRGFPERQGELPAACLAEEILTPGRGRIRALVTIAGNVARSLPDSQRVEQALRSLDLLVCVDGYLNETTRHADVVLPPPRLLTRGHADTLISQYAIRNVARYSRPLSGLRPFERSEREILLRLAEAVGGRSGTSLDVLDEAYTRSWTERLTRATGVAAEPDPGLRGSERLLDLLLRTGPYHDPDGDRPGLDLSVVAAAPHGIDLGPLRPRLPEVLRTPDRHIDLAPDLLLADLDRLAATLTASPPGPVLIGRRQPRGMNSWLHNTVPPTSAHPCTLHVSPADAAELGLVHGALAEISTPAGTLEVPVEVTDTIRPGVVSLPHGWGHHGPDLRLSRASVRPGVNVNALIGDDLLEPVSGVAVLFGRPVRIAPATRTGDGPLPGPPDSPKR